MRVRTLSELSKLVGVKPRTIQFWTINDVIRCTEETKHSGPGSPRQYVETEVAIAAVMAKLSMVALPVGELKQIAQAMRETFFSFGQPPLEGIISAQEEIKNKYKELLYYQDEIRNRRLKSLEEGHFSKYREFPNKDRYESLYDSQSDLYREDMRKIWMAECVYLSLYPGIANKSFESSKDSTYYIIVYRSDKESWSVLSTHKDGINDPLDLHKKLDDWAMVFFINISESFKGIT